MNDRMKNMLGFKTAQTMAVPPPALPVTIILQTKTKKIKLPKK